VRRRRRAGRERSREEEGGREVVRRMGRKEGERVVRRGRRERGFLFCIFFLFFVVSPFFHFSKNLFIMLYIVFYYC
jgi:hypothetical protein